MPETLKEFMKPTEFPAAMSPADLLGRLAFVDWIFGALLTAKAWPAPVLGLSVEEVYCQLDALLEETAEAVKQCLRILGMPVQDFFKIRSFQKAENPLAAYESLYNRPWLIEVVTKHHSREDTAGFCAVRSACYVASAVHYLKACQTGKPMTADEGTVDDIGRAVAQVIKRVAPLADFEIQMAGHQFLGPTHVFNRVVADEVENVERLEGGEQYVKEFSEMTLTSLVPGVAMWSRRPGRARELAARLAACSPGRDSWREYEDICLDVLRFLFVPPFRRVIEQARTSDSSSRRDAVIPNSGGSDFWNAIRNEFDSKNIVAEFKNLTDSVGPGELDQLRLYLKKPTVGRFGLLITRKADRDAWRSAQRRAYEEDRVLILVLDDKALWSAVVGKAYLGTCDHFIEELKVSFELAY